MEPATTDTRGAAGSRRTRAALIHIWTAFTQAAQTHFRLVRGCLVGLAAVALVTAFAFRLNVNLSTSGSLYLLIVLLVSVVWGFWAGTVTSVAAVSCLNYFFVPPVLTFSVADPQNWIALGVFEITALTVGRLSTRLKAQERAELHQRIQLEKLYELSRRILVLDRQGTIGSQIAYVVGDVFHLPAVALFDADGARVYSTQSDSQIEELARNTYLRDGCPETAPNTWSRVLRLGATSVGAIALLGLDLSERTVDAIASLAATALERARSFQKESRAEAARHTEQLRTAVLDALAHAFKSPLTAIRTASSGLLETGHLGTVESELATLIDEQAEHLNELTSQLLQMARLDAAEVRLRRRRFSLLTLVEAVLTKCREHLRGRTVSVQDYADDALIEGDWDMLAAGFEQFIDNAIKYSPPNSPISISVSAEERFGEITVAVHNEGPPVRPADRERIFERFYRAEDSRHRAPGTGLGLHIVKKTAEAHGGRTWVESGEGSGTTFFLALPLGLRSRHETVRG